MATGLSAASIVQQLRDRFGIRGDTALQLEESVVPVANLGDLDAAPWNAKGGGFGLQTQAAVAAQLPYFYLRFPPGVTGITAVVKEIAIGVSISSQFRFFLGNQGFIETTLGGGGAGGFSWDAPDIADPAGAGISTSMKRCALQLISTTNAADLIPAAGYDFSVQAGVGQRVNLPWVIRPGTALLMRGNIVNVTATISFFVDEYRDE